mmetsp:Transcript_42298/g.30504  ORF Transcript_42298/g.30504 Transcript_42298/m.30504 type:complete len:152 (+) Transcript_42298:2149-2604(+)
MRNYVIFPSEPYERGQLGIDFMKAVKSNNLKLTEEIIRKDCFILYEFDDCHLTGLHWACKRGFNDMIALLIENFARIDPKDICGRTPLYFAVHKRNIVGVKMLLAAGAHPGIVDSRGKTVLKMCKSGHIKPFLAKAYLLKILLPFVAYKNR